MNRLLIAVMLLSALLVFGCIGGPQQPTTPSNGGQQGLPENGGETTPSEGGETEPEGQVDNETNALENTLGQMTIATAIASGLPYECTTTMTESGVTTTQTFWVKGDNLLVKSGTPQGTMTFIMKGDLVYMDASTAPFSQYTQFPGYEDCAWITLNTEEGDASADPGTAVDYTNELPNYEIDCTPAVFGDEKFATPGRACAMDDIMDAMYAGLPPGYEYPQ